MVGLPATGELTYNGYTFDGATQIRVAVEFVYDEAQRTITGHRHVLTVTAVIANEDGTDSAMESIRRLLGQAGGVLVFQTKGFGDDLVVNRGAVKDINNGPSPRFLTWEPLGDNKAVQIIWQVETTIPVCKTAIAFSGVKALNYGISYSIDRFGDTTRTLSGYLEIASNLYLLNAQTADAYRDAFAPPVIVGFQREQTWVISPAKDRCDFTIVDTEIASQNPYPENMVEISGEHEVSWGRREGTTRFNTISARMSPEAGLSGSQAWAVFLTLAIQRMSRARSKGSTVLIDSLTVRENLFGRAHSFSIRYRNLSYLVDFVGDTGLWIPLGTDWTRWAVSVPRSFDNRGNAQLRDIAADDAIVNLCNSGSIPRVQPNNIREFAFDKRIRSEGFRNRRPPPDKSWLEYHHEVHSYRDKPTVRQSILQTAPSDTGGWTVENQLPSTTFEFGRDSGVTADVIQEGGAGRHGVRIMGSAERAGYEIGRPIVETVGGQTASETWFRGVQWIVGNFFGVPVYRALWAAEYLLPASPGRITPPSDVRDLVIGQTGQAAQPSPGTTP